MKNYLYEIIKNKNGFSLIEIMVAMAILVILVAVPNFISYRDKSFCNTVEAVAQNVLAALSSYFSEASHKTRPDINDLVLTEKLAVNNGVSNVSLTGSVTSVITVTVTDASGRCPRKTIFTNNMSSETGRWS